MMSFMCLSPLVLVLYCFLYANWKLDLLEVQWEIEKGLIFGIFDSIVGDGPQSQRLLNLSENLVAAKCSSAVRLAALRALVHLRPFDALSLEVDFNIGMRRFPILLTRLSSPDPLFD